ncbi:MAG: xanthine dehydrogenase small subunit [Pleurocapsa sp.]
MAMTSQIHFILNDREVDTSVASGVTVLDYLRQIARLTGTKKGCGEGGCGACTIILGELQAEKLVYKSLLSCLLPLGELSGKHLVTIEGLNQENLSPIQQALVDWGATQCGFCTPGIVMSLTGYLLATETEIDEAEIKLALHNNLCRCTGYAAIKRAGMALMESLKRQQGLYNLESLINCGIIPPYFREIPTRLYQLSQSPNPSQNGKVPSEFVIAGGTDIYAQRSHILATASLRLLNQYSFMQGITTENNFLRIGALTTFADFANHSAIIKLIPDIQKYIQRIASVLIRQRATVGGNIMNASPIGDISVLLLALNASLVFQAGNNIRTVLLRDFFRGYKETAKKPGEILTEIRISIPQLSTKFNFEKITKRQYLDCAVVNSAVRVVASESNAIGCEYPKILDISISMGGVAPMSLCLKKTSNYLVGKPITQEAIAGAFPILQSEISPITDIHGSAHYKRLLARQILIAHFIQLFPDAIALQNFYETT